MIKAILFDFGGVIYEHPKKVVPVILSKIYHLPIDVVDKAYTALKEDLYAGKTTIGEFINAISSRLNVNRNPKEVKKLWLKYYAESAIENQQIINLIKKLKARYKTFLFSNTTEISHLHNQTTGIYQYFDGVFLSFQMKMVKPDFKFFRKVIAITGFKPDEYLLIDDTEKNLEAAKKLGLKAVLFDILTDEPIHLEHELRRFRLVF